MRRTLLAVLMAAGAMLVGAAPADAGGPTSVLLTNPGQARAAALYSSDPQYAELETLLNGAGSVPSEAGEEAARAAETQLNVTWLAHDVSVWRTDRVAIDQSGHAWIATWMETFGEASTSNGPTWGRLEDGDRIRDLAASLGLIGAKSTQVDTGDDAAAVAPRTGSVATRPPVVREETRWFTLTGWRWAVPGLLLGVLAASAARGRRGGSVPARQELIDGRPERVTAPG